MNEEIRIARRKWILLESGLLILTIICIASSYRDAAKLSWTYDDAFLLRVVGVTDAGSYFDSQRFWSSMPSQMFLPALLIWYEAGSRAAPVDAHNFYLMAIGALCVALAAIHAVLRRWFGVAESLTAVVLIGLGPPLASIVTQLMSTHYLLALFFAALAVSAYARAAEARPVLLSLLSALAYFVAMLAKEIAIPLPALLLLLPVAPFRRRIQLVLPHAVALGLYFLWRRIMIGVFFGGYGWAVTENTVAPLLRSLPRQIWSAMLPSRWWIAALAALVLLTPVVWAMRRAQFSIAALVAFVLAILPIVPVSREMQPRYVLATWVTLIVLFIIAIGQLPNRLRRFVCLLAIATVFLAHRAEWSEIYPAATRMSTETRFVLGAPGDAELRRPTTPPAAMGELVSLRAQRGVAGTIQPFYDDYYLCAHRNGRRVFEFDETSARILEITAAIPAITERYCSSIRLTAPLSADFRFVDGTLFWTFGPYREGTWSIVMADGVQAFAVPREDAFLLGRAPGLTLRVRYEAPDGWRTYSPEIVLDFARRPRTSWRRS